MGEVNQPVVLLSQWVLLLTDLVERMQVLFRWVNTYQWENRPKTHQFTLLLVTVSSSLPLGPPCDVHQWSSYSFHQGS